MVVENTKKNGMLRRIFLSCLRIKPIFVHKTRMSTVRGQNRNMDIVKEK